MTRTKIAELTLDQKEKLECHLMRYLPSWKWAIYCIFGENHAEKSGLFSILDMGSIGTFVSIEQRLYALDKAAMLSLQKNYN